MVTFTSWRVIFFVQAALGGVALILLAFFLPETIHPASLPQRGATFCGRFVIWIQAPVNVMKLFKNRTYLFVVSPFVDRRIFSWGLTSTQCLALSSLVWNMYSLLTPIRYVLNPRFNLTSPLQSGLLYIAPGVGYVVGSMIGGRWADHTVRSWIKKRGFRQPEDRLRSSIPFLGVFLPAAMVLYGWTLDKRLGSIPLPVICMFVQGVAQLAAFPSLNAHILDTMHEHSGAASGEPLSNPAPSYKC